MLAEMDGSKRSPSSAYFIFLIVHNVNYISMKHISMKTVKKPWTTLESICAHNKCPPRTDKENCYLRVNQYICNAEHQSASCPRCLKGLVPFLRVKYLRVLIRYGIPYPFNTGSLRPSSNLKHRIASET